MTLPHEFIFVFIQYFNGAILSKKSYKKPEVRNNTNRGPGGGWPYGRGEGVVYRRGGFQTFCTLCYTNKYIYIYIKLSKFYWTPDGIRIEKIISFEP